MVPYVTRKKREEVVTYVPDWCQVNFPTGKLYTYPTLQKANNARIMSKAWENWRNQELERNPGLNMIYVGWSAFARHLGIAQDTGTRLDGKPRKGSLSANAGEPFYQMAVNGRLPKDPEVRDKIYKLAGYPWQ